MQKIKGFTLLELLGVIALLAVIALLVITISTRMIKSSKQSLYETQLDTIVSAAKKWATFHDDDIPESSDESAYNLPFSRLSEDGYIDSDDLTDPRNNSKMCGYVKITYDDTKNQPKYKIVSENC